MTKYRRKGKGMELRTMRGKGQTKTGSMDLPIVNESPRRHLPRTLTGNSNFYQKGGRQRGGRNFIEALAHPFQKIFVDPAKWLWKKGVVKAATALLPPGADVIGNAVVGALGGGQRGGNLVASAPSGFSSESWRRIIGPTIAPGGFKVHGRGRKQRGGNLVT